MIFKSHFTFDAVSIFLIPKLLANKSMVAVATVMTCVSLKIKQMHYNIEIRILWSLIRSNETLIGFKDFLTFIQSILVIRWTVLQVTIMIFL